MIARSAAAAEQQSAATGSTAATCCQRLPGRRGGYRSVRVRYRIQTNLQVATPRTWYPTVSMMSTPAPRNSACAAAISGSLDGSASSAADQRVGCSLLGATSSGPGGRVNPQEGRSEDNGWQKKEGARSSLRSDNEERANKRCQADVGTRVLAARSRWVKLVGREGPFSAFHTNVQPGKQ